jgi:arsenical pump membrane protein
LQIQKIPLQDIVEILPHWSTIDGWEMSFVENIHAWTSLGSFFICILFVILSPNLPIFIPKILLTPFKKLFQKKIQTDEQLLQDSKEQLIELENNLEKQENHENETEIHISKENEESKNEIKHEEVVHEEPLESPKDELIEKESKFYKIMFPLDMGTIPIFILILLFCFTTLNWQIFVKGIIGDEFIKPYSIIILFMSLSYVCISLDRTGIFEFLAHWIIKKCNSRGHLIWFGLCAFSSVLTVFTSNDIVILTLTPITCYMKKNSKNFDPIPFVISQFFLANIWSMALVVGNPTNVIVAEAYKMNFLIYFLWMALPTIASGLTCWILLYIVFYKKIPKEIEQNDEIFQIKSKVKAIVKSIGLILCLVTFVVNSVIPNNPVGLWMICGFYGLIFLVFDIIDSIIHFRSPSTLMEALKRVPWKIPPFVVAMFVLVELLNFYQWTNFFTQIYQYTQSLLTPKDSTVFHVIWNIFISVLMMTTTSAFSCNILNNQPMTILFTNILHNENLKLNGIIKFGSTLGLIIGSNLGANITLIGALAGIMWKNILNQYDIDVGYFKFLLYGMLITPFVILASSFTLSSELIIYQYAFTSGNSTMTF